MLFSRQSTAFLPRAKQRLHRVRWMSASGYAGSYRSFGERLFPGFMKWLNAREPRNQLSGERQAVRRGEGEKSSEERSEGRIVMSAPVKDDVDDVGRNTASMYALPWVLDAANDDADADAALAAAADLWPALPSAPHVKAPAGRTRRRKSAPSEGDTRMHVLHGRPALDPVAVPGPRFRGSRRSAFSFFAWISVAAGAASCVAVVAGVGAPEMLRRVEESTKAFGARMFGPSAGLTAPQLSEHGAARVVLPPIPMPESVAAGTRIAAPPVVATRPPQVAERPPQVAERAAPPALSIAPPVRPLERAEIAALYERGEKLITQGEIAAARLVFARAAGAGDARSAFALGASYDPELLKKLGVLGVEGDAALAREWYAKASAFGSREAAQRIELMALGH
jgi:hypothetical protein